MTTALSAISSYRDTKALDKPHRRMISNDVLNAFYEGSLDKDSVLGEETIGLTTMVREAYMARQEAEDERKRNLLLSLMHTVELEAQSQGEADAEDLRRHCE
jgi:hypothetical protein